MGNIIWLLNCFSCMRQRILLFSKTSITYLSGNQPSPICWLASKREWEKGEGRERGKKRKKRKKKRERERGLPAGELWHASCGVPGCAQHPGPTRQQACHNSPKGWFASTTLPLPPCSTSSPSSKNPPKRLAEWEVRKNYIFPKTSFLA